MTSRGLVSANTGIGLSAEQVWADGAPQGGVVSTAIGVDPTPVNMADADGIVREAKLVQALGNTPAGYDLIPGWFARVDVKIGEWAWCLSRTRLVEDVSIAGAQRDPVHEVVATIDMEKLAHSMAEVKDDIKFVGTVAHPRKVKS